MKKLDNIQKLIWEHSAQVNLPSPPDKEAIWSRLSQHMDISDMDIDMNQDQQPITPPKQRFLSKIKPRITYAVALGLALIFVLPIAYDSFTTETFVTQKTDLQIIQLPDGSTITLNAESQIKYKKNFNTNHRSLTMTGEAYFEIKNGNTPFVIHTNQGQVTVLGTSFNVLSRKDGFEVGVNDGIVKVSNDSKSVILHKGQMIDVDSNFDQENLENISYVNYPDWMHKKLVCEQTPLAKVCNEIERTFGISFEFANPSYSDITVTGIIDAKDLNTVLSTISLLTQHEFKFDGDTCTIF